MSSMYVWTPYDEGVYARSFRSANIKASQQSSSISMRSNVSERSNDSVMNIEELECRNDVQIKYRRQSNPEPHSRRIPPPSPPLSAGPPRRFTPPSSHNSLTLSHLVVTGYTIRRNEVRVMYHIDVHHRESRLQTYTIRRSYSDFKLLYTQLEEVIQALKVHMETSNAFSPNVGRGLEREKSKMIPTLPPLPSAGLLSYWRRHDRTHLQRRSETFQQILDAIVKVKSLKNAEAFKRFLRGAPEAIRELGSSYVSLCEYSVSSSNLERSEEVQEWKKLALQRRSSSSAGGTLIIE